MKVILGSDHAGFAAKEKLKKFLEKKGIKYEDFGPKKYVPGDDYPDYAIPVAKKVAQNKNNRGILFCGTGTGMVIAANKIKGIRAVSAFDTYSAKKSRQDNNTNILGLRGRYFPDKKIISLVQTWLTTEFSNERKHVRRLKKITQYTKR